MCLAPNIIRDKKTGVRQEVACKGCDLCRKNRVNDLIGRCIAEQCTASRTVAVTLTYAGDGPESAALRYSDVQKMLKLLRAKKGGNFKVRYICAGEYGTKKGRAHWHIILFFYGRSPDVQIGARINWHYWPHGFSYFQNPDYKGFHYVLKYALKQDGNDGASKALSMSKKPPLGCSFFKSMADDLVERRLPVHSPEYAFAHVRDHDDKPRRYWLQGRMRELFLDRYYTMWRMQYGNEPPWSDFMLEGYLDRIERKRMDDDPMRFDRDKAARDAQYNAMNLAAASKEFWQSQKQRIPLGYLVFSGTADLVQAYSDDSAVLYIGDAKWQVTVGNVTVSDQLLRGGLPKSKLQPVLMWLESQWMSHRDRLQKLSPN
nr:MAG: replication initiator protein [Microvirus sp.]